MTGGNLNSYNKFPLSKCKKNLKIPNGVFESSKSIFLNPHGPDQSISILLLTTIDRFSQWLEMYILPKMGQGHVKNNTYVAPMLHSK